MLFAFEPPFNPVEHIEIVVSQYNQIIKTNDLEIIEKYLDLADSDTLVLWDVDQTLHTPLDAILKPQYDELIDELMGGKKFIKDKTGKVRYLFREILMSAPHRLVDIKSLALVENLQKRGIPTIAFSAAPGGKIGQVTSFVDWRIDELNHLGFDFSPAFSGVDKLSLPKDPSKEFPPIYKSGVLITSLHDKGPVLKNFFEALKWQPKKVIFIDNELANLQSVADTFGKEMQVIGFHYTAASDLPCQLDLKRAKLQVDLFIQTGVWISDEQL